MKYSLSFEESFKCDSVKANRKGVSSLVSSVKIGIFATRPVAERRPAIFAKIKEGLFNFWLGNGFDLRGEAHVGKDWVFGLSGWGLLK